MVLAFADGAVLFTSAIGLGLVTLHADDLLLGGHVHLREKLYLTGRIPARVTRTGSL
jgi:hypothetical protein